MLEVVLIYPTSEGSREIAMEDEKLSLGRGSEADFRFEDDGLSRLHATVYRDGDQVWIVDENSTNGTFVNGEKVEFSGKPLKNGDAVKIGHYTTLQIKITSPASSPTAFSSGTNSAENRVTSSRGDFSYFLPLAVIGIAVLVITASAVFISVMPGESEGNAIAKNEEYDPPLFSGNDNEDNKKTPAPTPKNENSKSVEISEDDSNLTDSPDSETVVAENIILPSGKKYLDLSDSERNKYVEVKALKVARMIGNSESKSIPPAALEKIKAWVDGFARRINTKSLSGCRFGDNLQTTYERASKNAPFIIRAFNARGIDPQIGLYLAMIESEHCVCLQSNTGPLGMFQFTYATAKTHFSPNDGVRKGATPSNGDVRCEPEPSARAAASYMKALMLRYGTGPLSVPLAVGSYNSGEGGLSTNLKAALEKNESQERSFWTLIANAESLSKQFQLENVKYVPKFFAAAIVGENPQDFGLKLQPLSTYSN